MLWASCQCGLLFLLAEGAVYAQTFPHVACKVEDYELSPGNEVQVVVLQDPSGEQTAEFDLTDGASLVSLRYQGKELLYGHSPGLTYGDSIGAFFSMYRVRPMKGLDPFASVFNPTQGAPNLVVPATVAGVACHGHKWMNAFAMMINYAGDDEDATQHPLLGVWKGRLSGDLPPGFSTRYALETEASWVPNPAKTPKYYLRLQQTVVNIGAEDPGTMHWVLLGTVPWSVDHEAGFPESCTSTAPCQSSTTPAVAAGRYEDAARSHGVSVVVPTKSWMTDQVYVVDKHDGYVEEEYVPEVLKVHYFGVELTSSLAGSKAHRFQWYVCAGSWKHVREFVMSRGY